MKNLHLDAAYRDGFTRALLIVQEIFEKSSMRLNKKKANELISLLVKHRRELADRFPLLEVWTEEKTGRFVLGELKNGKVQSLK